jgi:hypothetical protein
MFFRAFLGTFGTQMAQNAPKMFKQAFGGLLSSHYILLALYLHFCRFLLFFYFVRIFLKGQGAGDTTFLAERGGAPRYSELRLTMVRIRVRPTFSTAELIFP